MKTSLGAVVVLDALCRANQCKVGWNVVFFLAFADDFFPITCSHPTSARDRDGRACYQIRSGVRCRITAPQISRTIIAPTTAPISPAPSSGPYHPKA
jgi:hypothetical protein